MPSAVESLINAAREQADKLRAASSGDASEYGMQTTRAEADMW